MSCDNQTSINETFILESIELTGLTYTNSAQTPTTIGGIANGSTFSAKTMQEMWDSLLYPYQTPAFTSFGRSNLLSVYELGQNVSLGSQVFTWSTSNSSNIITNSIKIEQLYPSTSTLISGTTNDGSQTINLTTAISTPSVSTLNLYRISGNNSNNNTFSSTISASWRNRWYYGKSNSTNISVNEITGFTSGLVSSVVNSYVSLPGISGFGYLLIPSSMTQPTNLVNSTSGCFGNNIPYANVGSITFNNSYGVSVTYNIYKTINTFSGQLDVWLCS